MPERRVLLALLLLAATVAFYIWGKQSARPPEKPKPPEKAEAEERAKAEPFPLPVDGKKWVSGKRSAAMPLGWPYGFT